jgi:DNA-directed RNA polymerase specialized sigma24 family protein
VHDALVNWAAWCRSHPTQGRCFSAEGRYVPPAQNLFHTPEPRVQVDEVQAQAVNAAMLDLPEQARFALWMRYFRRVPDRVIARSCGVGAKYYVGFMRHARLMLRTALRARKLLL